MRMRQRQAFCACDKAFWPFSSATVQAPDTLDQVIKSLAGLARINRQRDQAVCHCLRDRELSFAESALLKSRRVMQRGVMRAHLNPFFEEHLVNEIVSRLAKLLSVNLDRVKVEDVFAGRADRWQGNSGYIT